MGSLAEGEGAALVAPDLQEVKSNKAFNPDQVDDALSNIRHSLDRDLPQFIPDPEARKGSLILVGGGPSMAGSLLAIRRMAARSNARVIAFNDAITYLMARGVPVWGTVFMEVAEWRPDFLRQVPLGLKYLVASEAHPSVYDRLLDAGADVMQWHALEDIGEAELIGDKFDGAVPLVPGGVTALTRAFFLGHAMGYRRFEVFGADSSHGAHGSHAYYDRGGQKLNRIQCAGEWFEAPGYLVRQCEDLISIVQHHHGNGMNIRVHGSGMFPHAAMALGVHAKSKPKG